MYEHMDMTQPIPAKTKQILVIDPNISSELYQFESNYFLKDV